MNAKFGMIGLGTMGRSFLLNVAEQGFSAVGYDLNPEKRDLLLEEGEGLDIAAAGDIPDFVEKLARPRNIMLLVPAGPIVDSVIGDLTPHLGPGDLVIDGGNSHFPDTERREVFLNEQAFEFLGVGVSGGEAGARHGASIMVGGKRDVYERVRPIFEAASAKVGGEPCAAHVGTGSAGHFVKMVHNGIEYGLMQLIAETYDLLKRGSEMSDAEIAEPFDEWNKGELNSFLIEITATVLRRIDGDTGRPLVEMILDTAGQKGTGRWTSQAAMDLGVPIPTIDSAVTMRQISARKAERVEAAKKFNLCELVVDTGTSREDSRRVSIEVVRGALYAAFIATYAQGLSLLQTASSEKNYELDLVEIAKIWRGGCIIRAALLEDIRKAFKTDPFLVNLLVADPFLQIVMANKGALMMANSIAAVAQIPAMSFAATYNYVTAYFNDRLPANLIQAQRDYFGAHTYQRVDSEGTFHTPDWRAEPPA